MQHAQPQRQLTVRAAIAGMLLGGFMSLSNLYVSLKTGWSMGVSITAGILAFAIFSLLLRLRIVRSAFGMLENNAMQSVASAAGYMTGGGTVAAIPALMMITGETMDPWSMFFWISMIAMLGVVMAIPMKQQMINVEQLRFPTGTAAAETLRALHAHGEASENKQARFLTWAGISGAVLAFLRDAHGRFIPFNFPAKFTIPGVTLAGRPLVDYTFALESSLILIGAGMIMGFRAAWSMMLGAVINYGGLAPWLYENGVLEEKLGYRVIVGWSVWFGSAMILTSGLLAFAFQWKTVVRAVRSVSHAFGSSQDLDAREVPMTWFFIGCAIFAPIVIFLQWYLFDIKIWMGILAVFMSFFIAIVACRATGETDTTPTGALGKITQITFGALDAGNVTTNLMTANVTGGVGLHSADLLTDLKSGYLLKADPRQQFWAQFLGVAAGSLFVVPAYHLLIPTPDVLGSDQWPAPGAQTWKSVAELLVKGFETLHPTAQVALLVGGLLGIAFVLLERYLPRWKKFIPSPVGLGLAFTMPAYNTIAMFIGACIALWLEKKRPELAEKSVIPIGSGFIAGESLMGVLIAILVVIGVLS
ncbi:OPT family oligopeptide transporter [Oligoflexus tunisiensis]|uniref:OPT family oligopeptide transporter n=1 Tax=Oligoflexus tunisiensis TaxID=708132 RepID=UPI000A6BDBEB|nr:OPT family oligopeptide transporter [Oligoflexus tunisiensis]